MSKVATAMAAVATTPIMHGRVPTESEPLRVLALGAGVQSSYLFLASCLGELPRLDAAIFADTRYEPSAVYEHLAWLVDFGLQHGIPIIKVSVGDLRRDAVEFRQNRVSDDGKRHASVPFYVAGRRGKRGQIRRQCTSTYKIEPIERCIREQLLGLRRGQAWRGGCVIEQWIGISHDERRRCSHPGVWTTKKKFGRDMFGERYVVASERRWRGLRWQLHAYPLCGTVFRSDRTVGDRAFLGSYSNGRPRVATRSMCEDWLRRRFPERKVPRSACIGCPYRSNAEWRRMRDEDPESWRDAVAFDREIRIADATGQSKRKLLVGLPFVHDSLVPLGEANIGQDDGKTGAGCGVAFDARGLRDEGSLYAGLCGN